MTLQVRPAGSSGAFWNPARDLAHCWPNLLMAAEYKLLTGKHTFKPVEDYMRQHGVTEEDRIYVIRAATQCLVLGIEHADYHFMDCLRESGFDKAHPAAQLGFFFYLANANFAACWSSIRMANEAKQVPDELAEVMRAVEQAGKILCAPRWKRWWWRLTRSWPYLEPKYGINGK